MFAWGIYRNFQNISLKVVNKHSPVKEKYIRTNQLVFITKEKKKT